MFDTLMILATSNKFTLSLINHYLPKCLFIVYEKLYLLSGDKFENFCEFFLAQEAQMIHI